MSTKKPVQDYCELSNCRMYYKDSQTDGPTILCLHGRFGRGKTWLDLMGRFSDRYRVIAPDQRGHGLSSKPVCKYTAEEMADDVFELMIQLKCSPAIVVGHSMGARVAGYLSTRHPESVSSLALLDHSPLAGRSMPTRKALHEIPDTDAFTKSWPLPFGSEEEVHEYIAKVCISETLTEYFLDSLVESSDGYTLMFSQQATSAIFEYQCSWAQMLPSIQCPVLLVRAKHSNEVPDADWVQMRSSIPVNVACEVSLSDHHVYLSGPEEFSGILEQFLTELQ